MKGYLRLLGDFQLVLFGILLIYIFLTIEIWGVYGVEANAVIRRVEVGAGLLIMGLGIYNITNDIKGMR